jgi:DNA-binding CsgD family transcriptional regulator
MNSIARLHEEIAVPALPATRGGLARYLSRLAREAGADHYMLVDLARERGADESQILASNWSYDTVRAVGIDTIKRIASAPCTTFIGERPRLWTPTGEASAFLGLAEADTLEADGHREMASARMRAAGANCCVIFSAQLAHSIDAAALPATQMALSYALSGLAASATAAGEDSPISDRERECLLWVSEGKTTDEVAVILGVSSNTVNSYVVHAIHKLSARNRAMAIATAIRTGLI